MSRSRSDAIFVARGANVQRFYTQQRLHNNSNFGTVILAMILMVAVVSPKIWSPMGIGELAEGGMTRRVDSRHGPAEHRHGQLEQIMQGRARQGVAKTFAIDMNALIGIADKSATGLKGVWLTRCGWVYKLRQRVL